MNETINETISEVAIDTYSHSERIVGFLPDPLFFLIVGGLSLIIYFYLPEDMRKSIKNFLKNFGFYIFLALCYFYFKDKWGMVRDNEWPGGISQASFVIGFILLMYWGVKSWMYEQRYYTNHLISDNVSGSCHRYQEIEATDGMTWIAFFLGTSGSSDEKFVFPWPWSKKVLFAPKICCEFLGNQILVKAQTPKVDVLDLDENLSFFVENDTFGRWCLEDLYCGIAPVSVKLEFPEYRTLENVIKKQNNRINELAKMLKGKLTDTKGFISDTMAMTNKLQGKDSFRRNQPTQRPEE